MLPWVVEPTRPGAKAVLALYFKYPKPQDPGKSAGAILARPLPEGTGDLVEDLVGAVLIEAVV